MLDIDEKRKIFAGQVIRARNIFSYQSNFCWIWEARNMGSEKYGKVQGSSRDVKFCMSCPPVLPILVLLIEVKIQILKMFLTKY